MVGISSNLKITSPRSPSAPQLVGDGRADVVVEDVALALVVDIGDTSDVEIEVKVGMGGRTGVVVLREDDDFLEVCVDDVTRGAGVPYTGTGSPYPWIEVVNS